jgi:hypothetical protein
MNEKIDGVNPNVEIYSAGVLDSDNETTVDRLVEGIEWAMECGVKILDINCGLETDSAKLHAVIKKAYKQGILIIAPAGNGKAIEYPAKYPEVMAVGAVKCNANLLECSVHGEELKVVNILNRELNPLVHTIDMNLGQIEKCGYPHFMLKEIFEQPECLKNCMRGRINADADQVTLSAVIDYKERLLAAKRIIIVACGTSWHAGLIGKQLIETL